MVGRNAKVIVSRAIVIVSVVKVDVSCAVVDVSDAKVDGSGEGSFGTDVKGIVSSAIVFGRDAKPIVSCATGAGRGAKVDVSRWGVPGEGAACCKTNEICLAGFAEGGGPVRYAAGRRVPARRSLPVLVFCRGERLGVPGAGAVRKEIWSLKKKSKYFKSFF